ncbi:MAG: caspase family protein [Deltaproteobacteria bacterium]|nr:caspase family protein [Deltaproteobacteria bacterium]
MELRQSAPLVESVAFSTDGKYVLTGSIDGTAALWDISSGSLIKKFSAPKDALDEGLKVAFSSDGLYGIAGGGNGLTIWDLSTGNEIKNIGASRRTRLIAVASDNRSVLTGGWQSGRIKPLPAHMILWDMKSGNRVQEFRGPWLGGFNELGPLAVAISPDKRYALCAQLQSRLTLWDVASGREIRTVSEGGSLHHMRAVAFSPNGQYALSGGNDGNLRLWTVPSLDLLKTFKAHEWGRAGIGSVVFSPDGRYALSGGASDGFIKVWDLSAGVAVKSIEAHSGMNRVWSLALSPNGKFILSGGDASTRLWDFSTSEEIATMVSFENGEWVAITSKGYYNSSEKGAQYLNVKFEGKDYTIDQFYDVFYRPDIVAAKLRGEDISGLVTITMQDAIKSPPPVVEFASKISDTDQPKVKVCYQVKSTGGGIGEVRLFHNGKLIQSDGYYKEMSRSGSDKKQLASLDSKSIHEDMRSVAIIEKLGSIPTASKSKGEVFEDCRDVEAIPGENEVSVAAFNNSNTVQSYMKTVNFNSKIKQEDPHLYILAVGIDQYKDNAVNLKYAVKDAKDIEERLKAQSATLYKPQNIHYVLLTDKEATKTNISYKINELSQKIKPNDSFILFVAGHGVLLQNQYYMLTHDYNGSVSDNSMISSNEIVEMSKKIKSLFQLFIFDTCHAGGVDTIVSGLYDARMSVLAKKMGLHIYASASDRQVAMDGYKDNGLFTYTLLDGLNNNRQAAKNKEGKVSIVGLGEYSKKMTTNISKDIGHEQTPLIINFGKDYPIYQLR